MVFPLLIFMMDPIMNLINRPYYKCERKNTILYTRKIIKNYFIRSLWGLSAELKTKMEDGSPQCCHRAELILLTQRGDHPYLKSDTLCLDSRH